MSKLLRIWIHNSFPSTDVLNSFDVTDYHLLNSIIPYAISSFRPSMNFAGFMRSGSKVEGFLLDPSTSQGVSIRYDANHDTVQVAAAALPSTTQGIK